MRKLLALSICRLFIVTMILGCFILGLQTSAQASNILIFKPQLTFGNATSRTNLTVIDKYNRSNIIAQGLMAQVEETQEVTLEEGKISTTPEGCVQEGFFSHSSDCKKFRRCVLNRNTGNFTEYIFDCAPGTDLWCQETLTCAFSFQCPSKCS